MSGRVRACLGECMLVCWECACLCGRLHACVLGVCVLVCVDMWGMQLGLSRPHVARPMKCRQSFSRKQC